MSNKELKAPLNACENVDSGFDPHCQACAYWHRFGTIGGWDAFRCGNKKSPFGGALPDSDWVCPQFAPRIGISKGAVELLKEISGQAMAIDVLTDQATWSTEDFKRERERRERLVRAAIVTARWLRQCGHNYQAEVLEDALGKEQP